MSRIVPDLIFVTTADFQLVFNFEQTRTVIIFGEHGIMAHIRTMMAKPARARELIAFNNIKQSAEGEVNSDGYI